MKSNNLKLLVLLTIVSLAFSSCKDDDDKAPANSFKFDGQAFTLNNGEVEYWSMFDDNGDEVHNYYIYLYNDEANGKIAGTIGVELIGNSDTDFAEGTYSFTENEEDAPFHVYSGFVGITTLETGDTEEYDNLESGTVKVSKSGDTYTITLDVVIDGESLSGKYVGPVERLD